MSETESPYLLPSAKKIDIEFENISYTVPHANKSTNSYNFMFKQNGKKQILKGISGKFKSGELTAIMGPSGAGKSSLLNILTGFDYRGMEGIIKCNGKVQTKSGPGQYKKDCCYILQNDQLIPLFTVSEIMSIAADLKLGHVTKLEKYKIIDNVLETLNLSTTKKTRCGQLSGGQKKRLSIALELLDNPPIMFLDEPTTGLDSSSSLQCISTLKALAKDGRTIICTIHQPSATMFEMFDHIYVISNGRCIYQGDSSNTVTYLSSEGLVCPQYHNSADFLLEVANGDYGDYTDRLSKASENSQWRTITVKSTETTGNKNGITSRSSDISYPPSELSRFWTLLKRTGLQLHRDWTISHLRLIIHLVVGIFLGCLYKDFGNDGSKTIFNLGYLMVTLVYLVYTSMMPAVLKFPAELPVLRKEKFNNWYQLKTYYAAYMVANVPIQIIFALAYASVSYVLSDQPLEFSRFIMFVAITSFITLTAESFGILLGTTVDPINGTFLGAITLAAMLSVSGFLLFYSHMPSPLYFLTYLSYIAYGFEGLVQATYDNRGSLDCPTEIMYCHYKAPDTLLQEIGIQKGHFWYDIGMLGANFFVLKVIGFIALKKKLSCR